MILIVYRSEGNSGYCRHGCCNPDETWGSEMEIIEAASYEDAVEKAAVRRVREHQAEFEFHLVRPATAAEVEACGFHEEGDPFYHASLHGDMASLNLNFFGGLFQSRVKELQAAANAAAKEAAEKKAAEEKERQAADTRRRELAALAALQAKYPNG